MYESRDVLNGSSEMLQMRVSNMTPKPMTAEEIYNRLVDGSDTASLRTGGIWLISESIKLAEQEAYQRGYSDAREQAAKIVEQMHSLPIRCKAIPHAIRSMKPTEEK